MMINNKLLSNPECCFYVEFIQTTLYCITLLNKAELLFNTKQVNF